ncbi:hypothetical protein JTE90_009084 [Oedothorax gibbosus]|uniref:Uncharacterized protein n=1 Tax=Oedothorax gibbosus TaxID=931172 RepID=A0AAV6UZJ7_9ARAC|nr:hypothetical protein JTE90_009084 [Oedothorax gibbosus]
MANSREFEDDFFETGPSSDNLIRLSHLNNKSSVLCPEKPDITSQYLALQQLEAHQRMISRAKSIVDTSAPKSLQSYISVADRQRKKRWQRLNGSSKPVIENLNGSYQQLASSRLQTPFSEEEDNVSLNASTVNKCVQTGIPFEIASSKTADKISWYLEALKQGEIFHQPTDNSKNSSVHHNEKNSNSKVKKKVVKGDFMDRHEKCFVQPKKPFSPRILPNYSTKAKLKDMKCYKPPVSKKESVSSHSSDTFESYDNEEESEDDAQKSSSTSSVEEESHIKSPPQASARHSSFNQTYSQPLVPHQNREYFETSHNSDSLSRNEEDEYLDFLSKVTEDILRSGVYSDKAIRQSFEFHMQFYKDTSNKEKLQSLLNQVLEGLKISSDNSEETASYRNPLLINFSRPNTPPVKDSLEILLSTKNNPNDEAAASISTVQRLNFNSSLTDDDSINIHQNTLQDNVNSNKS